MLFLYAAMKPSLLFVLTAAHTITAAIAATPGKPVLPVKYVTRPLQTTAGLSHANLQGVTSQTIPLWTAVANTPSGTYQYRMVGQNPMTPLAVQSMAVHSPVIPLIFTFADGSVFDPTSTTCSAAGTPLSLLLASPIFNATSYTVGGTNVGTVQYLDFFQRANFWNYVGGSHPLNPNYHTALSPTTFPSIHVPVPAANGNATTYNYGGCSKLGAIDINWFDSYLQNTIFPNLAAMGLQSYHFPIFVTTNVVLYDTTPSNCCILGFHSAFANPHFNNAIQTYAIADFDTSTLFGSQTADIASLSHEIGEWMDDPWGNNPTPVWGNIGQVTGCQSNLEVGDPLSGTGLQITMPNHYTYHPQELAFFSWFYRQTPSIGVNGWFSSNGTFSVAAAACP